MTENITYRLFTKADQEIVSQLISAFYQESPEGKPMTPAKISRTLDQLSKSPSTGTILLVERPDQIIGYALLINFWSNEYGGNILVIDELYILPSFRSRGIGSQLIKHLAESRFNDCIALDLEVLPYNQRALQLYQQLGFQLSDRAYLLWEP